MCDFILYCDDRDCCEKKYYLIKEINAKDSLKKNKMIKYLIEDLKLALNENIYTHDNSQDKDKEKNEDIKENVEDEEKAKINISNISKNQTVSSHNINPINIEKK